MLTSEEMEMPFAKYCVTHNLADLILDDSGYAAFQGNNREKYNEAVNRYWDKWEQERKEYYLWQNNEAVNSVIARLKNLGYEYEVKSLQNAHINVKSKHTKRTFAYYATTGTIAGYGKTPVKGIDCLIELLNKY